MIVVLTVFKYAENAPAPAQQETQVLENALQAEMIDTGTIIFYYSRLKFFGTEVAGQHWNNAALYAVPDLDAMRRWCMWDKHRAVDLAYSNVRISKYKGKLCKSRSSWCMKREKNSMIPPIHRKRRFCTYLWPYYWGSRTPSVWV